MKKAFKKSISVVIALMMVLGVIPFAASAANDYTINSTVSTDDYYNLISKKDWDIAPGITESEIVLNNDSGDRRQVMHVVEVDIHNEYTKVIPSYKGMIPTAGQYGVQTMDQQAAYAEANGYGNVVAAMNISLSWYNTNYYAQHPEYVGEPLGYMILDGKQYTNSEGQTGGALTCLVINFDEKDGVARPADLPKTQIRSTADPVTGWEEQVIPANFGFTVKDGELVVKTEEHASEGAPRSMIGIKADGSIILVMNDGRQAPYSIGFNTYEMGEAMLALGCVYAINGDGGGSSQFLSQRPGEELEFHCSPSDGSPRATTHGVLVISTAPSTGEFVRAHVESENVYYTPGSTVRFTAIGADLAGGAAEIPAEAVWQLADSSYGTIDNNGLFISNGKKGAVTAQIAYNGEVKGEATINVVDPDYIAFEKSAYAVPFDSKIKLGIVAKYGVYDVTIKPEDYTISLSSDTAGQIADGNIFTSGNVATSTTVTVTYKADTAVYNTAPLSVGKGSEVLFDFEADNESGDINNWVLKVHAGDPITSPKDKTSLNIVNRETGMVHSGEQAIAINLPFHNYVFGSDSSYEARSFQWVGDNITLENATSIGFWIYVPKEATQTMVHIAGVWYDGNGAVQRGDKEIITIDQFDGVEYSGWHYVSMPIDKEFFYIGDSAVAKKRNFFIKFYSTCEQALTGDETSYFPDVTYYVDDVIVDYSSVVADRENPIFSNSYANNLATEGQTALPKGTNTTLAKSEYSFCAKVSDNMTKDNATGINAGAVAAYIDGVKVNASYRNGEIVTDAVTLDGGTHRVEFEAFDNEGNLSKSVRFVTIEDTKSPAVQVVPKSDATSVYTGSVYWVDVKVSEAEKVKNITMKLDLDTMHAWELDYAELNGCKMNYYFDTAAEKAEDIVTVELTLDGTLSGEATVASLPARVWYSVGNCETGYGPELSWSAKEIIDLDVNIEVVYGVVSYIDYTTSTFSAKKISVDTEAITYGNDMQANHYEYFMNNTYHVHTETAVDDKAATCDEAGYTGRTYCEVCDSVVDWGTKVEATGHSFDASVDGLHTCKDCGETYYYVDSDALKGWQTIGENIYYFDGDGVAANGKYTVDGHEYTFENFVLIDAAFENDGYGITAWWAGEQVKGGVTYESKWKEFNGKKYYFTDIYAATGLVQVKISTDVGYKFQIFEKDTGVWMEYYTGLYEGTYNGKTDLYYAENGICVYKGLVFENGYYYYIESSLKAIKGQKYYVARNNGLLPQGEYEFDAEGRLIAKNGIVEEGGKLYYYETGLKLAKGLVYDEKSGNYYYFGKDYYALEAGEYFLHAEKLNGLAGPDGKVLEPGFYTVNADRTIYFEEAKNGIVEEGGKLYYYEDGAKVAKGLVKDGNKFYYFGINFYALEEGEYFLHAEKLNGLAGPDGKVLERGFYTVNADRTIRFEEPKNGIVEEGGKLYYYEDDAKVAKGLVKDGDKFYYFGINFYALEEGEYFLHAEKLNGLAGPDGKVLERGFYTVNADRTIRFEEPKNGIVEEGGKLYYYENNVKVAKGLVFDEKTGNYYYFGIHLYALGAGEYWFSEDKLNGLIGPDGEALTVGMYTVNTDSTVII